jgi:hypothetical protein
VTKIKILQIKERVEIRPWVVGFGRSISGQAMEWVVPDWIACDQNRPPLSSPPSSMMGDLRSRPSRERDNARHMRSEPMVVSRDYRSGELLSGTERTASN